MLKNTVGIRKELDSLGRLVIPKEMRELFRLDNKVELLSPRTEFFLETRSII